MLQPCWADCCPTHSLPPVTAPVTVPDAVARDAVLSGVFAASSQEPPDQWLLVAGAAPVPWMDAPKPGLAGESRTNVGASGMDQGLVLQSHLQVGPLCQPWWGDAGGG